MARLFAYLDDIVLVVPRAVANAAFDIIQRALLDTCGLSLAVEKTQVWSPRPEAPLGQLHDFWCPDGLIVLGGPMEAPNVHSALTVADHGEWPRAGAMAFGAVAGPCVLGLVETRLRLMEDAANLVVALHSRAPPDFPALHIAYLLLLYCVAPKADHLLRHLPPAFSVSFAPRVDQLLLETLQTILGVRLNASQARQIQFTLSEGGVGLLARSGAPAAAAYVGSWALVYHRVAAATGWSLPSDPANTPNGSIAHALHDAIQIVHEAGAEVARNLLEPPWWAAALHEGVPHVQRTISRALRSHARNTWLAQVSRRRAANLLSHSGWGAGAALSRCPTEQALRLDDTCVRVALCERLGLRLASNARCNRRFRSGRICRQRRRFGTHVHCCPGLAGVRTRLRHNPLAEEWCNFLRAAGRFVELEQRDPSLGPGARLDIVEYPSAEGGPAAYDVSVVTSQRQDRRFVAACARTPGFAAARRHEEKLNRQYAGRLPQAHLVPLVAESGGRWHPDAEALLRQLARAYVRRTAGLGDSALSAVIARWVSRLSATLLRGNAAALRHAGWVPPLTPRDATPLSEPLGHGIPEGDCSYELLVGHVHTLEEPP